MNFQNMTSCLQKYIDNGMLFLETLKLSDGAVSNLQYHQSRIEKTAVSFGADPSFLPVLTDILSYIKLPSCGLYKIRLLWTLDGHFESEVSQYARRRIKTVRIIDAGKVSYMFKFADRSVLPLPSDYCCDEVIMAEEGMITDSTFSNLCFSSDGIKWYTPDTCLLDGTMRRSLLDSKAIESTPISVGDLVKYRKVAFINALNGISDMQYSYDISTDCIGTVLTLY